MADSQVAESTPSFFEEVVRATPGQSNLERCIQCGSCGGSCPSGPDMEHTPRHLFELIQAGLKEEVLSSNSPWYCVSCYYCMARCPQDVHITDLMYTLKRLAIQEGFCSKSSASDAPDFSETFIDYVEEYGRSFELGLATRYHLRHHPIGALKKMAFGLNMLRKGRLDLKPKRIKNVGQLKAILAKAKELGGSEK